MCNFCNEPIEESQEYGLLFYLSFTNNFYDSNKSETPKFNILTEESEEKSVS